MKDAMEIRSTETMEMRSTVVGVFDLKALHQDGTFEGYGSVFGNRDSFGDVVAKGAFKRTLKEDHRPAMLWQHDSQTPIGVYTEVKEDKTGLFVKGKFTAGVRKADEALLLLRDGALDGLSIGFQTKKSDLDEETGERIITEAKLYEVSLVTFPANDGARVMAVKNGWLSPREIERALRDAGASRAQAKRFVAEGYTSKQRDIQRDAEAVMGLKSSLNELLAKIRRT